MTRISIIGIGWLGLKLAAHLKDENLELAGTVRTEWKKEVLADQFTTIDVFQLEELKGKLAAGLASFHADCFFLCIPPSSSEQYVEKLQVLIDILFKLNPNSIVIYTSSISVYGGEVRNVTEDSALSAETENAEKIMQIERHLIKQYPTQSIILRLGGLIGADRHPINHLAGRKRIPKANAPVNLIHEEDICRFVALILEKKMKKGVFNLCCEEHPTKISYYRWLSKQLKIKELDFDVNDNKKDKIVFCTAIKSCKFELRYKSPFDFPISEN